MFFKKNFHRKIALTFFALDGLCSSLDMFELMFARTPDTFFSCLQRRCSENDPKMLMARQKYSVQSACVRMVRIQYLRQCLHIILTQRVPEDIFSFDTNYDYPKLLPVLICFSKLVKTVLEIQNIGLISNTNIKNIF